MSGEGERVPPFVQALWRGSFKSKRAVERACSTPRNLSIEERNTGTSRTKLCFWRDALALLLLQAEAAKDSAEQALGLVAGPGSAAAAAAGDSTDAVAKAEAAVAGELGAVSLDSDKEDVGADPERDIVAKVRG
jgi:hypothetical protein